VFENVQAQAWGVQELEDEGIPVEGVKPSKDKITRAEGASLHYEMRRVTHAETLRDSTSRTASTSSRTASTTTTSTRSSTASTPREDGEPGGGVAGAVVTTRRDRPGMGRKKQVFRDPRFA
jgi:hypothetical protein